MTLPVFKSSQYAVIQFEGTLPVLETPNHETNFGNIEDFKVILLSGISFMQNKILEADFASEIYGGLSIDSIIDSQGEWAAIAASTKHDEFAILADAYGYCPVFYSIVNDCGIFISDTFQGVVAGLRDFEIDRHLNVTNYSTVLAGLGPQFQNAFSHETMASEVQILPVEQIITITQQGIRFTSRANLGDAASEVSYESALNKGIDSASKVINTLNDLMDDSKRVTLSGGVDSRLAFGILLASSENVKFDVHAIDPRNWGVPGTRDVIERDIKISNEIRSESGLNWWKPGKRDALSLDFRESLALYQSYRSNISFQFSPSSMHIMYQRPLVTLRGGGGELIRSTDGGASMAKALRNDKNNEIQDVGLWLGRKYLHAAPLSAQYRERAYGAVSAAFASASGETFEEQMNSLYFNFRNRAHFGHARHTASTNETTLHVLSNPYFLRASKLQSFELRSSGRMAKDIFNESTPSLRKYPFENKYWSDVLSFAEYDSFDWSNDSWKASVEKKAAAPLSFRPGWGRGQRAENYQFNRLQSATNYILEGFALLEELVSSDEKSDIKEQHSIVWDAVRKRNLNRFHIVAKVASALDVFFASTSGTRRLFSVSPSKHVVSSRVPIVPNIPSFSNNGISNNHIFEQYPTIAILGDGFEVRSNPSIDTVNKYVYAFYLYRDGKKIDQIWYQEQSSASFNMEPFPGVYHAVVFARYVGRASPTFHEMTSKISISHPAITG